MGLTDCAPTLPPEGGREEGLHGAAPRFQDDFDDRARLFWLPGAVGLPQGHRPFDVERERANPEWGDPGWRLIPAGVEPADIAVAHLHISDEDLLADPEIALPARLLDQLVEERVVGGATAEHMSVMGYQERSLAGWRDKTAGELAARLVEQRTDGLILAPA